MSSKTLRDAQASVQDFLNEARFCAENQKGFAAMCVVFPVIFAISEAVHISVTSDNKSAPDSKLVHTFIQRMRDKRSWFIAPSKEGPIITDEHLADKLTEIRNALAHELSLPIEVILVNTMAEVAGNPATPSDKWLISTSEFVEAVRDTAMGLIEAYQGVDFDPSPRGYTTRAPSKGEIASWGSSASGIDLKNPPSTDDWGRKPA